MTYVISFIVLVIIGLGIWQRKNRKVHYSLMTLACIIDVGLVLWIELNRGAVDKAIHSSGALLTFHVAVSVGALLLYFVQFYLGFKILRGNLVTIKTHKVCGITFVVLRLTNFITSFMVTSS